MFSPLNQLNDARSLFEHIDADAQLRAQAALLFEQTVRHPNPVLRRLLRNGKKHAMRSLADLCCSASQQHYAGLQTVTIDQIIGSENRTVEFDNRFTPQAEHLQGRWVSVAVAYFKGLTLPPIDLIQVGDEYYVRDGHHRISVARTMGQTMISALVTVWE
ncbi:MAG TPA: hypothetical protein VHL11_02245 [Phototrophicaceae bacterium]|jgi:hypothetical protein|nr:hypothetical protein [Phototrophicaceae bacterium]